MSTGGFPARSTTDRSRTAMIAAAAVAASMMVLRAGQYPVTLTATAEAERGSTRVTSTITISVDRLMLESRHTRVADALRYGGYGNFLNALRPLPAIGTIATDRNQVDVRYAWETKTGEGGRRLVLVADRPLFFLGGGSDAQRAGYELTVVDLTFDEAGNATGTIAGAARVKPSPDGVILGDFAEAPVRLTIKGSGIRE